MSNTEPTGLPEIQASVLPAAGQEAVAWQRRYKNHDEWFNISKHTYDETVGGKWAEKYDARELFAAPVAAAPVVPVDSDAFSYLVDEVAAEHGEMLDDGGPSGWAFTCEDLVAFAKRLMSDYKGVLVADAYAIARAEAKRDSTPAAPGIDLGVRGATLTIDGKTFTVDEVRAALIDASPKGGSDAVPAHNWCRECGRRPVDPQAFNCKARDFHMQATSAEVGEERCESGSPDCGPVEHWDSEAVPLCARCWKELTTSHGAGVSE